MGRTNPVALRVKGVMNWPSNVRHQFLSQYVKHIFQEYRTDEPGIRASTTGIWVNLTIYDPNVKGSTNGHPLTEADAVIDFRSHKFTNDIFGKNEKRVMHLLHGMPRKSEHTKTNAELISSRAIEARKSKSSMETAKQGDGSENATLPAADQPSPSIITPLKTRYHHYYGRLGRSANPKNQLDALGGNIDLVSALQIYKDTPIHLRVNIIKNPILNAKITAHYIAGEMLLGRSLPMLHRKLLENIGK